MPQSAERPPLISSVPRKERDNEIDWRWIVRHCAGHEPALIRAILFEEVAPVCGPNLCSPIPPVWSGFARDSLVSAINDNFVWRDAYPWRSYAHRLIVFLWSRRFAKLWKELAWRLDLANSAATPEELMTILGGPEFEPT